MTAAPQMPAISEAGHAAGIGSTPWLCACGSRTPGRHVMGCGIAAQHERELCEGTRRSDERRRRGSVGSGFVIARPQQSMATAPFTRIATKAHNAGTDRPRAGKD